ncbi:unnamed protein product [Schistosoma margrebowiei]|uniref:Uncharacterized protein n=1 Tax=Schistosoma margrebowiei TaxID=48269 RepID=A0A183LFW5_9TREM|nr:unnamed protein product [Schistosoma margrebowiei]
MNYVVKSINIDYINHTTTNTTYNVYNDNNESFSEYQIEFHLNDNTPVNFLVGNIFTINDTEQKYPHDHNHHQQQRQKRPPPPPPPQQQHGNTFIRSMLIPDTYFQLTIKGDLYTRQPIDRDFICYQLNCCLLDYCQMNIEAYLFKMILKPMKIQITIIIIDENDNRPLFPKSNIKNNHNNSDNDDKDIDDNDNNGTSIDVYELLIPESASIGNCYTLPMAIDRDSPRYGIKQYRLQLINNQSINDVMINHFNLESPFSLIHPNKSNEESPQLQVNYRLDREMKSIYYYHLIVEDHGQPSLQSIMLLLIKITDINDNPPIFIHNTTDTISLINNKDNHNIYIMENSTIGTKILHLYTKDLDEGENSNVTYWIDWKSISNHLNQSIIQSIQSKYSLNSLNGELIISNILDYENQYERQIILLIKAIDNGIPKLTSTISYTIYLIDINDNEPVIDIIPIQTTEINNYSSINQYQENMNDYRLFYENDPTPQLLRLITINDKDDCSMNKIHCELIHQKENHTDFYLIHYSNSVYGLLNQHEFDYELDTNNTGEILIGIQCKDLAEPLIIINKWFNITLEDLNDNWPQFNQLNYEFQIYENVPKNTIIGQIVAMDKDSGYYGQLKYELKSDNLQLLNLIKIDPINGMITTNNLLDRESINILHVFVTVSDNAGIDGSGGDDGGGGGGHSNTNHNRTEYFKSTMKTNTTSVKIHLLDINDNSPQYIGPLEIHIEENLSKGTIILDQLQFIDPDLGENSTISIQLIDYQSYSYFPQLSNEFSSIYDHEMNSHSILSIDNQSRLFVSGLLDREIQSQFMLKLIAYDHGQFIRHTCTITLTCFIDDMNDNSPELLYPMNGSLLFGIYDQLNWFNNKQSISTIPINIPYGTLITTIHGKDPDAGENGTIIYSIVPSKINYLKQQITKQNLQFNDQDIINHPRNHLKMNEEYSNYHIDYNRTYLDIHEGFFYFTIHEQTGELTTLWNNNNNQYIKNQSSLLINNQSINQNQLPKPGLYIITIYLKDKGIPQHTTEVIFYVNISESMKDSLYNSYINNKIILILIMICILILMISLIIIIIWVRLKSNKQLLRSTISNDSYKEYKTRIIIPPETQHLVHLSSINYEKALMNLNETTYLPSTSQIKWNIPVEYSISRGLDDEGIFISKINDKLSSYIQPHYNDQLSIHVYPFHVNESNVTYPNTIFNRNEWISTRINEYNPYQETSFIMKHSNEQISNIIPMDSLNDRIDLYGKDIQLLNNDIISTHLTNINNQYNNSICGSDSGVDSGTGIIITSDTYLPITSYEKSVTSNNIHENLQELHHIVKLSPSNNTIPII